MAALHLRARVPARYFVAFPLAVLGVTGAARYGWAWATPVILVALVIMVLAVHAATTRFVVRYEPEPSIELGSAFRRRRVPVREIAVVRQHDRSIASRMRLANWEVVGADGRILARARDDGLTERDVRAFETEMRNLGLTVRRF